MGLISQESRGALTWRHGLHVFGELAADAVIISADVMKTPSRQLLGIVELQKEKQRRNEKSKLLMLILEQIKIVTIIKTFNK